MLFLDKWRIIIAYLLLLFIYYLILLSQPGFCAIDQNDIAHLACLSQ